MSCRTLNGLWPFEHDSDRREPLGTHVSDNSRGFGTIVFFSLLFRSAINAVTVIPLITLLISWPVFAVTVTKSSYSNLPTLGPSAAHLSRKQMLGKTNLLKNFWVFWCWHKFLKIVSEFAKKKLNWKKNLLKNIEKLEKIFEIEKIVTRIWNSETTFFELEMIFKRTHLERVLGWAMIFERSLN